MAHQQAMAKQLTTDPVSGQPTTAGLTLLQLAPSSNVPQQFAPTTPGYQQIPQLQLVQGQQMMPYPTLYLQQNGGNIGQQMGQQIQLVQPSNTANQQFHLIQHPTPGHNNHQLAHQLQLLQTPQSTSHHHFAGGQLSQQLQLVQQPQLILVPHNQFVGNTPQTQHVFCGAPGSVQTLLLMPSNAPKKQEVPNNNTQNTDANSEEKASTENQETQNDDPCVVTLPTSDSVRDFATAAVASTPLEETTKLMKTISLDNSYSYLNYNPDMEAVLENTLIVSSGAGTNPNYGCKIRQLNCKKSRLELGPISEDDQTLSDESTTFTHDQHLHGVWMSYDDDRMFSYKPITADQSSDETATSIGSEDEIDSSHTAIQDDDTRYDGSSKTDETDSQDITDELSAADVDNSCEIIGTQYRQRQNLDRMDIISPYPKNLKQNTGKQTMSPYATGSNSSEGQKDSAFETSDSNSEGKVTYSPTVSNKSDQNANQISIEVRPPLGMYQSSQQATTGFSKINAKKCPKMSSKQTMLPSKSKLNPPSLQPPRDSKRKSVSPTPVSKVQQQSLAQRKTISPAARNFKASGRPSLKAGVKVTLPLRKVGTKSSVHKSSACKRGADDERPRQV